MGNFSLFFAHCSPIFASSFQLTFGRLRTGQLVSDEFRVFWSAAGPNSNSSEILRGHLGDRGTGSEGLHPEAERQ
jgi:hypothetical protein